MIPWERQLGGSVSPGEPLAAAFTETMLSTETKLPPHLQDLNPEQLTAVKHGKGPLLIFAGAGSGKTRVLTRRIANLIIEHKVYPEQILAVTFTNKAASEMKQRVINSFGASSGSLWVSTFHATCARILRAHAERLDYTPSFAIYDAADSRSCLKRVYTKLNLDPQIFDLRMVASRIDRAKNEFKSAEDIRDDKYTPRPIAETIAEIYAAYQKELLASNAMDFGDLICNVVTLFTFEKDIRQKYQEKFQHVMIDEYQDTNRVQYMLVKMLTEEHRNICVVGDDDQSIYAFRGATIENILNFKKDYPEATVVTLEQNYRSTKNILTAAGAIIAKNRRRQKKTLRTDNVSGRPIIGFKGYDEIEEAQFVAREIIALSKEGIAASEMAVFYRTNAQSRAIEEVLVENNIPYEIFGGHRFYERKEIKDILAYFKLLINPDDNEAFLRVINTPTRGIGSVSLGNLIAYAGTKGLSIQRALRLALAEGASVASGVAKAKFSGFVRLLDELTDDARYAQEMLANGEGNAHSDRVLAIAKLLENIATKSTYLKRLRDEDTVEAQSRIENIQELFTVATEFARNNLDEGSRLTLHDFLDRTSLSSDLDQENSARKGSRDKFVGSVSLMTLHLAKGLEFDVVFLIGMEEGLLPHVRTLESERELEEERRLCYVGITRARKRLYMTRARNRMTFGRNSYLGGVPSRFLEDLPNSLIDDRRTGFLPTPNRY